MLTFLKKNHGFTLLEIIIALFIFSIVSLIIVSALHNVINLQSASQKKAERLAKLQIALLFLSRDLEQTIHRPITTSNGNLEGFIGSTNAVTFTHAGWDNPSGMLIRSTLQRTRYELNDGILKRLTWPVLDQAHLIAPNAKSLLNSVNDLHFEYLDNKGRFQPVWPPLDQPKAILPLAVRVSLTLNNWGKIDQLYIIAGQPLEKPN
ncbi:MAG TPA: type II secretion system minor pseudopilin GspJ [Gammaproteobacteria bacterium]|nr:type II secretion system minor pseudopilin GspJ [Gammaproteobacteria bacterium]